MATKGNRKSESWHVEISHMEGRRGLCLAPKPRDYSYKVPKKVRKAALRSALSMKVNEDRVIILRDFPMAEIKTKKFKEVLDRFELGKALFVLDEKNSILEKSSKNIKDVKMMRSEGINVYDLLKYDSLVLLEPSVKKNRRGGCCHNGYIFRHKETACYRKK